MEKISLCSAINVKNSNECEVKEYSFDNKVIDLAVATITGRYPSLGYCCNMKSEELIYVIDGNGKLYFENDCIEVKTGDAILINNHEKYYWDCKYCVVSITCTPARNPNQYEIFE